MLWVKGGQTEQSANLTPPHMSSYPSSRHNPGLYQGAHPSSYPNRPGLTSEISGELTAYAIRAPVMTAYVSVRLLSYVPDISIN